MFLSGTGINAFGHFRQDRCPQISMSLFALDKAQAHLFPGSFEKAQQLASKILRSEYHTAKFCQFYPGKEPGTNHIRSDDLTSLLEENGLFTVDKIRLTEFLDARACTRREIDPFRIYFNPLMLLEMADKERESKELEGTPLSEWPCLVDKITFWREESPDEHDKRVAAGGDEAEELEYPNTDHHHKNENSLVVAHQRRQLDFEKKEQKRQRDAAAAQKKAVMDTKRAEKAKQSPAVGQTARAPRIKRTSADSAAGPAKVAKLDTAEPIPSTMTVFQKHVLMLTVLLVHEAQHLLMYALSDALDPKTGESPKKKFDEKDEEPYTDVGHYMERDLYGYCIQHAPSRFYSTPFGVDEVLGSALQRSGNKYILQPAPRFLALLDDPECRQTIEEADLQLVRTSEVPYSFPQPVIRLGRASEGEGHNLFGGSTSSVMQDSDDEEFDAEFAETHPDYTLRGKA